MKSLKKFLVITALTLCSALLLTSCNTLKGPANYAEIKREENYSTIQKLTKLSDYAINGQNSTSPFVKFYSAPSNIIYNKNTAEIYVGADSFADSLGYSKVSYYLYENFFFEKQEEVKYATNELPLTAITTVKLVDYNMRVIDVVSYNPNEQTVNFGAYTDLVYINGRYYTFIDGESKFLFEDGMKTFPTATLKCVAGGYKLYGNSNLYFIYDQSFNLLKTFEIPILASVIAGPFMFENGNVLIQYAVEVDGAENDYDLAVTVSGTTVKEKIYTKLYNLEKASLKEIKTDLIFAQNSLAFAEEDNSICLEEGYVGTIVANQKIQNKGLERVVNYKFLINQNGETKEIGEIIENQNTTVAPVAVNDGAYIAYRLDGQAVYVDQTKEEKVQRDIKFDRYNQNYFVLNGEIYDFDTFNEVAGTEDCQIVEVYSQTVLLKKQMEQTTEYYLLKDDQELQLLGDNVIAYDNFYCVYNEVTRLSPAPNYYEIDFCTAEGVKIGQTVSNVSQTYPVSVMVGDGGKTITVALGIITYNSQTQNTTTTITYLKIS